MRVLIAFDKFKDALTAQQACEAAATALRAKHPEWTLDLCPLTDGGDGFCATLTDAVRGQFYNVECSGPRGKRLNAQFGLTHHSGNSVGWCSPLRERRDDCIRSQNPCAPAQGHKTRDSSGLVRSNNLPASARTRLGLATNLSLAVIEMAATSGLALLSHSERDPWSTSSFGTGEQILAAARAGADAILLGVGGSATNDLGLGALAALGWQFLDADGAPILVPTPATWAKIVRIDRSRAAKLPPILVACDVTHPLLGARGATATFGPQKGLRASEVARLESEMRRMAALLGATCEKSPTLVATPGAGAAGGMAFGLMAAADARIVPGFDLVADWLDLPTRINSADLILTGEGRFDETSLGGKGPGSLVIAAQHSGKTVHVFAGSLELSAELWAKSGANGHAITPNAMTLEEALPRTAELLTAAVSNHL